MIILGIETSCDDTSVAILKEAGGKLKILSNIISSQVNLHAKWGGVVPNLAAREHLKNMMPVLDTALEKSSLSFKNIDLIAVTRGPGLIPALLIGTTTAKALSYLHKKPLLGIHHIEGHIYANLLTDKTGIARSGMSNTKQKIKFPILCLVVSGGHTQLILMKKHLNYAIIGETLDDAAGEAFDKVARILGLGYPGGPAIALRATEFPSRQAGSKFKISLPRPMIDSDNFNFSFSGLKTAVLYETKKHPHLLKNKKYIAEICHEFQQSATDVLVSKTIAAAKKLKPKTILLAGGVSANAELRSQMKRAIEKNFKNMAYSIPDMNYSMDNAAMIAAAGAYRWKSLKNKTKLMSAWKNLEAEPNLKLS